MYRRRQERAVKLSWVGKLQEVAEATAEEMQDEQNLKGEDT